MSIDEIKQQLGLIYLMINGNHRSFHTCENNLIIHHEMFFNNFQNCEELEYSNIFHEDEDKDAIDNDFIYQIINDINENKKKIVNSPNSFYSHNIGYIYSDDTKYINSDKNINELNIVIHSNKLITINNNLFYIEPHLIKNPIFKLLENKLDEINKNELDENKLNIYNIVTEEYLDDIKNNKKNSIQNVIEDDINDPNIIIDILKNDELKRIYINKIIYNSFLNFINTIEDNKNDEDDIEDIEENSLNNLYIQNIEDNIKSHIQIIKNNINEDKDLVNKWKYYLELYLIRYWDNLYNGRDCNILQHLLLVIFIKLKYKIDLSDTPIRGSFSILQYIKNTQITSDINDIIKFIRIIFKKSPYFKKFIKTIDNKIIADININKFFKYDISFNKINPITKIEIKNRVNNLFNFIKNRFIYDHTLFQYEFNSEGLCVSISNYLKNKLSMLITEDDFIFQYKLKLFEKYNRNFENDYVLYNITKKKFLKENKEKIDKFKKNEENEEKNKYKDPLENLQLLDDDDDIDFSNMDFYPDKYNIYKDIIHDPKQIQEKMTEIISDDNIYKDFLIYIHDTFYYKSSFYQIITNKILDKIDFN